MDISMNQTHEEKPVKKFTITYILAGILGIIICLSIGFVLGKASIVGCNNTVLGIQSSDSVVNRLALLFNYDIERPSQLNNTIQLAPSVEPTITPTIESTSEELTSEESTDDEPDLIWGGTNRNPKPSSTPSPNNYITVPEPTVDEEAPTPTPQYKYDWGRNNTPTPTPNKMKIETSVEATVIGVVQAPSKTSNVPLEVQNLIDGAGMQMENLQIIRSEGEEGLRVSGELREKLFGFLTVGYPISFKVDEDMGSIETASIPWWRSLFGNPFIGNISQIRCGDGICSSTESLISCKMDCEKVCGNGICEFGEGTDTCSQDCTIPN